MIFTSTTGLQVKAYGADEQFKLGCLKTARSASSNLLKLQTAGENRLSALLAFTDLSEYESKLGVPMSLAFISDYLAATLGARHGTDWLIRLLEAIQPGSDLSHVFPRYMAWLLDDDKHGVIRFAESYGACSSIRTAAKKLRACTISESRLAAHRTQGDSDIELFQALSFLENMIAVSNKSALESLEIAEFVPAQSANMYTVDSLAAGIAERVSLLAKKLLLDGRRAAERIKERASVSEGGEKLSSAPSSTAFGVDMIASNLASAELWIRVVILMNKTRELSIIKPENPFSIEVHAGKLLELVRKS
jgi:hypothetical protein